MGGRSLLIVAIAVALTAGVARGLKCRTADDDQDEFREVARQCMSNTSNWDRNGDRGGRRPGRGQQGQQGQQDQQDSRYQPMGSGYNRDNEGYQSQRNRNNNNNNNNNNKNYPQSRPWSRNRRDNYNRNNRNNKNNQDSQSSSESMSDNSDLENIEPCVIHCIFRQMQMLDDDAYPDRTAVTNIMMRNVQDTRVKEFVEQAVEECFELMESDNRSNKCESAKNLAVCLEEKGRMNCEDWDDPPDNQQKGNNRNSNSRNGNGYSQN